MAWTSAQLSDALPCAAVQALYGLQVSVAGDSCTTERKVAAAAGEAVVNTGTAAAATAISAASTARNGRAVINVPAPWSVVQASLTRSDRPGGTFTTIVPQLA